MKKMPLALYLKALFATFSVFFCVISLAQTAVSSLAVGAAAAVPVAVTADVGDWLRKLHESSRRKTYTGTFVVSTAGTMSSARIWHVCDGEQQLERVDTLTGPARTTLRRNDEVMTFVPESRVTVLERRESLSLFPAALQPGELSVGEFYTLNELDTVERVAGLQADAHELWPRDDLRFGYRVWSERKTGLVVKLQTLDAERRVLEQVAFSELNLGAPVKAEQLLRMMKNPPGYTVQNLALSRTTPQEQGWRLRKPVPGFVSTACHVRIGSAASDPGKAPMQWVFSDGLASVSVFVEAYDPTRHTGASHMASGATHSLSRRLGEFWVTLVGEVPAKTLAWFAQSLERTR